jgi:outer membrane lipoprotein-sorting protein
MKKRRNNALLIFLLLLPNPFLMGQENAFQPAKDPDLIMARIEEANRDIQTLQCDFEQEKELNFLEEKVFSSGQFYFERDNKIRWEYTEPYSYIIIMNGSMIRIVDEGRTNTLDASSNRLFNSINTIMAGIIDGSVIRQTDQFQVSYFENKKTVRIILRPLMPGMKDFISSIELDLNKKDHTVDALKINEKTEDYTLIMFKNKIFNEPVPEKIFDIR